MMSVVRRYWNFMWRTMLVAILTATSSLVSTLIGTQIVLPSWVTPTVTFVTLFIGSFFAFRRKEKQITSKLISELSDFSKTFHGLTMSGSSENRNIQLRFLLDRVLISDRSQEKTLQMRGNCIKTCHNLIEKWFKHYEDKVEYFSEHPKSIEVDDTIRLVNEFEEILSHYLREVINASIDFINDVKIFPKNLKEKFETEFDAFKSKYNYFGNQFNDYIHHLSKELSCKMDSIEIISKSLQLEYEKPHTDSTTVAIDRYTAKKS